jgi:predicted TIM-barrel fold metal-dependent hydrolase
MRILAQAVLCTSIVLCSSARTLEAPGSNAQKVQDVGAVHTVIRYSGPIFDVHLHTDPPATVLGAPNPVTGVKAAANALALRDATIEECMKYNVTRAVLNGWPGTLEKWAELDPRRFILAPMILNTDKHPVMSVTALRTEIEQGRAGAVGEITSQYAGLDPSDPILEPYWALAEAMDVPVMVHTGTSFPGTAYAGYPNFRLRMGNPLLLEDVLVKHPKLRLWIAHGGEPWTQETFALMSQYPQLYMDVSTIDWIGGDAGRPAFHKFLAEAIGRGFEKRIMFRSDQMGWPDAIGLAIKGVDSAPFLTPGQKSDIFYGNAMTFFRQSHVAVGASR